ncbi:MAG: 5-formyltetrahydrofolate cyclo-ligase [Pseudomonadota bacterium]|nr:MAG: 5-formyltetrahydrofolate cyclo-ligase [Pseudomonadota bacterium]
MDQNTDPADRKARLRQRLIAERRRLQEPQRRQLDRRICAHLLRLLEDRDVVDLAAFVPANGEPDLMPALSALHHAGRRIYLPVVEGSDMEFRRWHPGVVMRANRYGIPEPLDGEICPNDRLELVLLPLVAFSATGTRLGMGAGFYDRAFEFCIEHPEAGPLLVGAAYSLQEINSLPAQRWDVPLHAAITDKGLRWFA